MEIEGWDYCEGEGDGTKLHWWQRDSKHAVVAITLETGHGRQEVSVDVLDSPYIYLRHMHSRITLTSEMDATLLVRQLALMWDKEIMEWTILEHEEAARERR